MNLVNFLKQMDAVAAQCTAKQLASFIHCIGRTLPECKREDFLERLKAIRAGMEDPCKDDEVKSDFKETYNQVMENLEMIDSEEITISKEYDVEYYNWSNDWYDEENGYYYADESGVLDMLAEACEFVHDCLDTEQYKEGFVVGRQLFSIMVMCDSEYDPEKYTIDELVCNNILQCNLKQVALDAAYCAYMAETYEKRPEALYDILKKSRVEEITLETILRYTDEKLSDIQAFLPGWVEYLGDKAEKEADCLIREAVGMLNDISAVAGYARRFVDVHPGLYIEILENGRCDDIKMSLGMEAMEVIPKKYIMRSKAALIMAEYMIQEGMEQEIVEKCYFAAYESDTSVTSYLRAFFHGYRSEEKRKELTKIIVGLPIINSSISYSMREMISSLPSERRENRLSKYDILSLKFFDGQFSYVLEKGLNYSGTQGNFGFFERQGIAMYLMYLCEDWKNGKGIEVMLHIVKSEVGFSVKKYKEGLCEPDVKDENAYFRELFLKWRAAVRMDADVMEKAIKKVTALIEKYVDGIMKTNSRSYYYECAAFIAALGETRESHGDLGAKQRLMTSYRDKYFRRRNFLKELKSFGWLQPSKQ